MYRRILVAGRTDCAVRLIRACHDEGVQAFLVSSRDDSGSLAHELADGVVYSGMSREAYTAQDDILEAARYAECEAILTGWGFLSEDYAFAQRCRLMGVDFIGPSTHQLQLFGDKLKTIQTLLGRLPAGTVRCDSPDLAKTDGPWMLKCRFGGGGKNIERIDSREALTARLNAIAKTENLSRYFVEPAVDGANHIEFQVMGDGRGRVEMLGARDCTPQIRHQKYLEKSLKLDSLPAPLLDCMAQIRRKLADLHYLSWGTVEFLVHPDGAIHFLELNPRLQVEHGVTEMTTGIDLVRSAIRLSCSGKLEFCRTLPAFEHAIEYRLFAEHTGMIKTLGFPSFAWPACPKMANAECRIETGYRANDRMTGVYDGLVARFVMGTSDKSPEEALKSWMSEFQFELI